MTVCVCVCVCVCGGGGGGGGGGSSILLHFINGWFVHENVSSYLKLLSLSTVGYVIQIWIEREDEI